MTTEPHRPVQHFVAAVGPKRRCVGCNLEPMVANEEEVVRTPVDFVDPVQTPVYVGPEVQDVFWIWIWPNEVPGKDFPKYFGRDACRDVR